MPNTNQSALSLFSSQSVSTFSNTSSLQISSNLTKEINHLSCVTDKRVSNSLSHRKSCEFSHHSPVCIKKAAENLSQIDARLHEWYDNVLPSLLLGDTHISSEFRDSSSTESKDPINENKTQVVLTKSKTDFFSDKSKYNKIGKKQIKSIKIKDLSNPLQNIRSGSLLNIFGYDFDVATDQCNYLDVNHIPEKSRNMIKGVTNLLERLETDRLNMVMLLKKETERTHRLKSMLDIEAYKRIHDLPRKVQEEHDKCICDIRELKWHLEYQSRLEAKACELAQQAIDHQEKIRYQIVFINENNPHLDEKLDMESDAMKVIKSKQDQLNAAISSSNEEFDKIRQEFQKVKIRAEKAQRKMAEKISSLSSELNENLNSFLSAQNEHIEMKEGIRNIKRQIKEDNVQRISGGKHLDNLTEIGLYLKEKVENCKANIKRQDELQKTLLQDDADYQEQKVEENEKLVKMRKQLESTLSINTKELRRMIILNKKTKKEIQTIKRKMEDCEKTKLSNQKAVKRVIEELETVQEHLQLIKEQALDLKHLQVTLQLKMEQETLKGAEEQEKLNEQLATLQKENKEESHARKTLLARIKAETTSFEFKRVESETKKKKMLQTDEDLQKVIENMKGQINSLSEKYNERVKAIEGLNCLLDQVGEKSSHFSETRSREILLLKGKDEALNVNVEEISAKLVHIDVTSLSMNKKLMDMESSTIMMNKFLSANKQSIADLQEEISELQMQLETANKLDENLRISLAEVSNRAIAQQQKHSDLMMRKQQRQVALDDMLAESLLENDRLATDYLNLQSKHINEKNSFINSFEKHKIAQENFNDKESLCELHSQLHEALKCYYKLRGIQTKAGLFRFEEMTKMTYGRLRGIQENLEKCIHNISVFLRATNRSQSISVLKQAFTNQKGISMTN